MSGCFGLTHHHHISRHSPIDPPIRNVELLLLRPFSQIGYVKYYMQSGPTRKNCIKKIVTFDASFDVVLRCLS